MKVLTGFCAVLVAIAAAERLHYDYFNSEYNTFPSPTYYMRLDNMPSTLNEDVVDDKKIGRRYQLMYEAATWEDARCSCVEKGGKLAAPKTMYEFKVIQRLVRRMRFPDIKGATGTKLLAWLGISSLEDWKTWKNIDGEDIRDTGFSMWAEGNGGISNDPAEPHCAVIDAVNLLRDWWCRWKQPYVCEYAQIPKDSESESESESDSS